MTLFLTASTAGWLCVFLPRSPSGVAGPASAIVGCAVLCVYVCEGGRAARQPHGAAAAVCGRAVGARGTPGRRSGDTGRGLAALQRRRRRRVRLPPTAGARRLSVSSPSLSVRTGPCLCLCVCLSVTVRRRLLPAGLRCRECKYKCHRHCEEHVPPSCGLPKKYVDFFIDQFNSQVRPVAQVERGGEGGQWT